MAPGSERQTEPHLLFLGRGFKVQRIELIEELCKRFGFRITVATYGHNPPVRSSFLRHVVLEGRETWMRAITDDDTYFHLNIKVLQLMRAGGFDAVVAAGFGSLTTFLAQRYAVWKQIPFILWHENTPWYEEVRPWYISALKRRFLKRCTHCWATGAAAREHLVGLAYPEERTFTVPYVVDAERFARESTALRPRRSLIRRELGLPEDVPVVIQVGKLVERKGIPELLDAIPLVLQRLPACFLLVGDGLLAGEVEAFRREHGLEDRLVHVPFVANEDLPRYYAAADVFSLFARNDIWGLVVNEAAACGLPMILSDRVGARLDLLKEGENGLVVPIRDAGKFANAVLSLLSDEDRLRRMSGRSREIGLALNYDAAVKGMVDSMDALGIPPSPREAVVTRGQ